MSKAIRRGDIIITRFDMSDGHVMRGTRPAVVVQNDVGNRHSPTTIVVPLTSSIKKNEYAHARGHYVTCSQCQKYSALRTSHGHRPAYYRPVYRTPESQSNACCRRCTQGVCTAMIEVK